MREPSSAHLDQAEALSPPTLTSLIPGTNEQAPMIKQIPNPQ
jgi:hypothetical protein